MQPHNVERKLAAILNADVKGFSRLMDEDEEATLHTLTAYREIIDALIHQHRGRIVGTAGDSVLAEFASVMDAVRCAVEVQRQLRAKNADLPVQRRMEFRIGLNLGDVMVEGEQIYGDGVNIAARLQGLADAGGIYIAGTVYDHIKNKLALRYEDLREHRVKNIAEPVRVWWVQVQESEGPKFQVPSPKFRRVGTAYRRWMGAAVADLLLIAGTIITVWYLSFSTPSTQPLTPSQHSVLKPRQWHCPCPTNPPSSCCPLST